MAMQFSGGKWGYLAEKEKQRGLDRRHEDTGDKFLGYLGKTILDLGKTLGTEYFEWKVGGGEEAHEIDEIKAEALKTEAGAKKTTAETGKATQEALAKKRKENTRLAFAVAGLPYEPASAGPAPSPGAETPTPVGQPLAELTGIGKELKYEPKMKFKLVEGADGSVTLDPLGWDLGPGHAKEVSEKELNIKSKQAGQPSAVASIKAKSDKETNKAILELQNQLDKNLAEQEALSKRPNNAENRAKMKALKAEAARLGNKVGARGNFNKKYNLQNTTKMKASYFGPKPNPTRMALVLNKALAGSPSEGKVTSANAEDFFAALLWNAANSTNEAEMKEAQEILRILEQIRDSGGGAGPDPTAEQVDINVP